MELLAQGVLPDQRRDLADQLMVAADSEHEVMPQLQRGESQLFQSRRLADCERLPDDVRERIATPQRECIVQLSEGDQHLVAVGAR